MRPLIWLNGPFGVGKTTVTAALCAARPGGFVVVNPERLGYLLVRLFRRRSLWGSARVAEPPRGDGGDYQEQRAWRRLTIAQAAAWARLGRRAVIVPMSVFDPGHRAELLDGLRARGVPVYHLVLKATPATLLARIEGDVADPGAKGWRLAARERVPADFGDDALVIDTDGRLPAAIADDILGRVPPLS